LAVVPSEITTDVVPSATPLMVITLFSAVAVAIVASGAVLILAVPKPPVAVTVTVSPAPTVTDNGSTLNSGSSPVYPITASSSLTPAPSLPAVLPSAIATLIVPSVTLASTLTFKPFSGTIVAPVDLFTGTCTTKVSLLLKVVEISNSQLSVVSVGAV
jgi:hypothetical protein